VQKPLRVLFISPDASRTGAPMVLLHTLQWIRQHRSDIDFEMLFYTGGALEPEFRKLGRVAVIQKTQPKTLAERLMRRARMHLDPFSLFNPIGLRRYYSKRGIGLIYSNTIVNEAQLSALAGLGMPVICHVHELRFMIETIIGAERFGRSCKLIHRFIAVSEVVKRNLIETHAIPESRISLVYEFISLGPAGDAVEPARTNFIKHYDIMPGSVIVGGCGLVSWRKGSDLFVQTAHRLRQRFPDRAFTFLWAGKLSDDLWVRQFQYDLEQLGSLGRVHFLGEMPDPSLFYRAIDVFYLTSRVDPFPLVMLEAALAHKPIVCFERSGGAGEFVAQDCGRVVPYADVESAATTIAALAADGELRERLGRRGAEKVRASHGVEAGAPRIADEIVAVHARSRAAGLPTGCTHVRAS
jgi:glycosyltransferase involved in cell wall biosynthesis